MTRTFRSPLTFIVVLALLTARPAPTRANELYMRLDRAATSGLSALKSATITVKTTNRRGANGLLVTAKITGARDLTGVPANLKLIAVIGFGNCNGTLPFQVNVVNGSAHVTVTGTDIGVPETNSAPGRNLQLCEVPFMYLAQGSPPPTVLEFHLYNPTPGKLLVAPFILSTAPGNPLTAWKAATLTVQNRHGAILATTKISGALEGTSRSSRTIIPEIPTYDGVSCSKIPYFLSAIFLSNGNGQSTTPNLDNGGLEPGEGICLTSDTGLEDSDVVPISTALGVIQGVDPD